jgi:hypothetical protein
VINYLCGNMLKNTQIKWRNGEIKSMLHLKIYTNDLLRNDEIYQLITEENLDE